MSKLRLNRGLEAFIKSNIGIVGSSTPPAFPNTYSLEFDGTTAHVETSNPYSVLDGKDTCTISLWIKPDSATNYYFLLQNRINTTSNQGQFCVWTNNSGGVNAFIDTNSYFLSSNTSVMTAGVWMHILICIDFTLPSYTEGVIYINGVDETLSQNLFNRTAFATATNSLLMGRETNNYLPRFAGLMDEVAIWDTDQRANKDEIYSSSGAVDLNNLATAPAPNSWWRMGDSSKALYFNEIWEIPDEMKVDNFSQYSFDFDGIDDKITATVSAINSATALTFSFWGKKSATGEVLGGNAFKTSTDRFILYWWTNSVVYLSARNGDTSSSATYTLAYDSDWHHFAGTYDGGAGELKLYIDGTLQATVSSGLPSALSSDLGNSFNMGYVNNSNWSSGNIDSVSIFDATLSAGEVTAIYNSGTPTDLSTFSKRSFYFDGIDNYIGTGTSVLDGATSFTVSAWVNTSYDNWQRLFGDNSFAFALKQSIDRVDITFNGFVILQSSNFTLTLGKWHHVAVVFDGSLPQADRIKLYLDNSQCNNLLSGTTSTSFVASSTFNIGRAGTLASTIWVGLVDDFAVFNSVKTIGDLYGSGKPTDLSAESGLAGYWKFDDALYNGSTTEFNVPDSSTNSNDGTTNSMDLEDFTYEAPLSPIGYWRMGENGVFNANTEWELPNYQKRNYFSNLSMDFDGVDDYIDMGASFVPPSAISISVWIKTTMTTGGDATNIGYIVAKDDVGSARDFSLIYRGTGYTKIYFSFFSAGGTATSLGSSAGLIADGEWHHVLATWDGTTDSNKVQIFIDGSLDTQMTANDTGIRSSTGTNLTLGGADGGSPPTRPFIGSIDDVAIFSNDQSANVATIFNSGVPTDLSAESGLVGYWRMGEGSYWNATNWQLPDYSKKALFSQKSFEFDGVDDRIDIGSWQLLDGLSACTISFWIKSGVDSSNAYIIAKTEGGLQFIIFQSGTSTSIKYRLYTSTNYDVTGGAVLDNEWHHCMMVYDGSTFEVFEDGASVGSTSATGTLPVSTGTLRIASAGGGAPFKSGNIDDVAIFNSAKAIGDIWDGNSAPTDLSAESGLVGYWTFDDATFSTNWTVPDNSTNSNNGTSANMDQVDLQFITPTNSNRGLSSGMAVDDVINQAPENMEQGVSVSMDIEDRETDAPDNENQANSVSMRETAPPDGRSTDTP